MTSAWNTEEVKSFVNKEKTKGDVSANQRPVFRSRDQSEYLNPFQKWKVTGTESRNLSEKRMGEPIWRSWIILSTEAKLPEIKISQC